MTDRELLELAAKAMGISIGWIGSVPWYAGQRGERIYWDPLTDDGDALRLAAKLRIAITYPFDENCVRCWHGHEGTEPVCIELGEDLCTATRRAVVTAAAEIGKAMK